MLPLPSVTYICFPSAGLTCTSVTYNLQIPEEYIYVPTFSFPSGVICSFLRLAHWGQNNATGVRDP